MNPNSPPTPPFRGRLFWLDGVRVFAIITVFFFHCARFFDHHEWHVKNSETSDILSLFVRFVALWIMPLFFFISGISARNALSHGCSQYMRSRVTRLLVPFLFGTCIVLAPVQVWVERVTRGGYPGGFFEFYPEYFSGWYGFGGNFAWMGLHLWYLQMLFLFSIITLPFFVTMMKMPDTNSLSRLSRFGPMPVMILPVIAAELLSNLDPGLLGRRDWGGWPLLSHLAFFSGGYYASLRTANFEHFAAYWKRHLAAALAFTALLQALDIRMAADNLARYVAFSLMLPMAALLWIASIIGFGIKKMNSQGKWLPYANEAVLPFYMLHQTVIVLIGFAIKDMSAGIAIKYALISGLSFVIILLIYEGIRRFRLLRFLFGMKTTPPPEMTLK